MGNGSHNVYVALVSMIVVKCLEQSSYISSLLVPIFCSPEAKAQVELLWSVAIRRITFCLNDI